MVSIFCLTFSISHFIFFVQTPSTSKVHLTDEQLMTNPSRICHFIMHEYISPHDGYHIPDGHMVKFPVLCDYIHQGQAKQMETHKKFREICQCQ
jgi:hypothetical protein